MLCLLKWDPSVLWWLYDSCLVSGPQAAMCYVHVAALVAEYLRRKGALNTATNIPTTYAASSDGAISSSLHPLCDAHPHGDDGDDNVTWR